MSELVAAAAKDELLILPRGKVRLHGIDFDEDFFAGDGLAQLEVVFDKETAPVVSPNTRLGAPAVGTKHQSPWLQHQLNA